MMADDDETVGYARRRERRGAGAAVHRRLAPRPGGEERGEAIEEHHLSFESWARLAGVLTPRRLELLRHRSDPLSVTNGSKDAHSSSRYVQVA
jgi:predicted transcriptional regulator